MHFSFNPLIRSAYIREWLRRIDANKDGVLTLQELQDALRDLKLSCPDWRAQWAIGIVDANGNGLIDLNDETELKEIMEYANKQWGDLIHISP